MSFRKLDGLYAQPVRAGSESRELARLTFLCLQIVTGQESGLPGFVPVDFGERWSPRIIETVVARCGVVLVARASGSAPPVVSVGIDVAGPIFTPVACAH